MGAGEGVKGNLKNEDLENSGTLEPDPRYIRCCSAVCRPGYALRDALLGLLVLLGLSVIVTVIFVVCFYVVPDEKQLIDDGILLPGDAQGVIGGPNNFNEISLQNSDKYNIGTSDRSPTSDVTTGDYIDWGAGGPNPDSVEPREYPEYGQPQGEAVQPRENVDIFLPPGVDEEIIIEEIQINPETGEEKVIITEVLEETVLHRHAGEHNEHPHGDGEHFHGPEHHEEVYIEQPQEAPVHFNENDDSSSSHNCNPVQLPMCISAVPWSMAGRPNWLNHTTDGDMFAFLPFIRSSLIDSGCSALAPLYACSVLEPPCTDTEILPPCRSFCEGVFQSCHSAVQGLTLPGLFECNNFPDSEDPNVCVSAKQECSGENDFKCASTDLCIPTSWICDGADDCRDNSDEQNCDANSNDDNNEYPQYDEAKITEENNSFNNNAVPPFAYQDFGANNEGVVNDPSRSGPTISDPDFIREINEGNEDEDLIGNENFGNSEGERYNGRRREDNPLNTRSKSKYDPSNINRPKSPFLNRDEESDTYIEENETERQGESPEDQSTDFSVNTNQFDNHPIPDLEYPAKETFSVDSSSSVDQNYPVVNKDEGMFNEEGNIYEGASRSPSQRIRQRFRGSIGRQSTTTDSLDVINEEESERNQRPTRPPSRLESFQTRFREWQAKRKPSVPSEFQNYVHPEAITTKQPVRSRTRPYELIRRRPQRISESPLLITTESIELLKENEYVNREELTQETDFTNNFDSRRPEDAFEEIIPEVQSNPQQGPIDENNNQNRFRQGLQSRRPGGHRLRNRLQQSRRDPETEQPSLGEQEQQLQRQTEPEEVFQQSQNNLELQSGRNPELQSGRNSELQSGRNPELQSGRNPELQSGRNPELQSRREQVLQSRREPEIHSRQDPELQSRREEELQSIREPELRQESELQPRREQELESRREPTRREPELQPSRQPELQSQRDPELQLRRENELQSRREPNINIENQPPQENYYDRPVEEQYYEGPNVGRTESIPEYASYEDYSSRFTERQEHSPHGEEINYRPKFGYEEPDYTDNTDYVQNEDYRESHAANPYQTHYTPEYTDESQQESQFNLPNNFRVSFPPPRQDSYDTPNRQSSPSSGSSSFYRRNDAPPSDMLYDVPQVVESRQYPVYQDPPRRPDYYSPYNRR